MKAAAGKRVFVKRSVSRHLKKISGFILTHDGLPFACSCIPVGDMGCETASFRHFHDQRKMCGCQKGLIGCHNGDTALREIHRNLRRKHWLGKTDLLSAGDQRQTSKVVKQESAVSKSTRDHSLTRPRSPVRDGPPYDQDGHEAHLHFPQERGLVAVFEGSREQLDGHHSVALTWFLAQIDVTRRAGTKLLHSVKTRVQSFIRQGPLHFDMSVSRCCCIDWSCCPSFLDAARFLRR